METIVLKRLLFYSFLAIMGVIGCAAYLASLVVPDWEVWILFPFWHSFVAWLFFGFTLILIVLILYFIVDLAIDKEALERENKRLKDISLQLERELNELKTKE